MGIQGLLPLLKPIAKQVHLSKFSGQTIGVDTYCWLHKGAYGCALEILEGKETKVYLNYVIKRLEMMLYHNVKPYLVLDGGHLPSKANKEAERSKSRQQNKAKGLAFLRAGNKSQACECFQKCIDITPEMALEVIKVCRERNIDYVVAPYEADSQLAYLMKSGRTQATITEDSDLLVYGCKKVIFKMDEFGNGNLVDLDDLPKLKDLKMNEFTLEKFRRMCILSGCDYLPSIKGVGLKTASKLVRKHSTIIKLVRSIRLENKLKVPDNYEKEFQQAEETFLYQLVFDPIRQCIVPLTPLPDGVSPGRLHFAGPTIPKEKAVAIALGNVNPITYEIMDDYEPVDNEFGQPFDIKIEKTTHAFELSNKSSGRRQLTPNISTNCTQKHSNSGKDAAPTPSRFMLPPLNQTRVKENNASEEQLMKMYTSLKKKKCALTTELNNTTSETNCYSRKHRLKNPFRLDTHNILTGQQSGYFATTNPALVNNNGSIKQAFGDEDDNCIEVLELPLLPSVCTPSQQTISHGEQRKENSSTCINDDQDSQLTIGDHKDNTPYGTDHISIVANKSLRVLNTYTDPSPKATPKKTLNRFVYNPRLKNHHDEEMKDQDTEVSASGYLSDDTSPPAINKPETEVIVKKFIQLKPVSTARHSRLKRCKSIGISKRRTKMKNSSGNTTLFSYFECNKSKRPRLDL